MLLFSFPRALLSNTETLFHIKQPPKNVISWISYLTAASTLLTASTKPLRPSSMVTGIGGSHSSNIQTLQKNSWGDPIKPEVNPCVIIRRLIAKKPVRHNQVKILLHGTVNSAISDVSASFQTHLWSNLTLESSGQKSLLLNRQLRGYTNLDPTTKHQKYIPANLVLHIYKRTNTHMNTATGQLIAGAFFWA